MTTQPDTASTERNIVITARPLSDYQDMFLLSDADLSAGPILDCAAGASPFGAQVRARGGTVVSADPMYNTPGEELAARAREEFSHCASWMAENRDNQDIDWSYLGSPTAVGRLFHVAADLFLADYVADSDRYVAAALPSLPFPNGAFRLTLSSHLLFCYPKHFSYEDHISGILELMRVTSEEVRIFPLIDPDGQVYPRLDELRADLAQRGVATTAKVTNFGNRGDVNMLTCRQRTTEQP